MIGHIDLSADNRLPALLAEREELRLGIIATKARLGEIDREIKDKLGGADTGSLPGWRIIHAENRRKGYSVAPSVFRALTIKRVAKAVLRGRRR